MQAVGSSISPSLLPQSPGAMSSRWPARPRRAGEGACPLPSPGTWRCPPGMAPSPTPSLPPAPSPPAAPFTAWTGKAVGAGPGGWWGWGQTLPGAQACSHIEFAFARTPVSPHRIWGSWPTMQFTALRTQSWVTGGHFVVTGPQQHLAGNLASGARGGMGSVLTPSPGLG